MDEPEEHPINPILITAIAFFCGAVASIVETVRRDLGISDFLLMLGAVALFSAVVWLLMRFIRNAGKNEE